MGELEEISNKIHDQISSLQHMMELSVVELPQDKIKKLGQELFSLERLMEELGNCIDIQKDQLKHLKELEEAFLKDIEDVQHMKNNIPTHLPRKKVFANESARNQNEATDIQLAKLENVKKTKKTFIREMALITMAEFESIPQYMKGRTSFDQVNAAVQSINTAMRAKYKILHQSVKALNSHSRKLQQRFKDQETKDTKGHYFVVEDDIRELTQMKVEKRFQGILNMLRHCQRLREIRDISAPGATE